MCKLAFALQQSSLPSASSTSRGDWECSGALAQRRGCPGHGGCPRHGGMPRTRTQRVPISPGSGMVKGPGQRFQWETRERIRATQTRDSQEQREQKPLALLRGAQGPGPPRGSPREGPGLVRLCHLALFDGWSRSRNLKLNNFDALTCRKHLCSWPRAQQLHRGHLPHPCGLTHCFPSCLGPRAAQRTFGARIRGEEPSPTTTPDSAMPNTEGRAGTAWRMMKVRIKGQGGSKNTRAAFGRR